MGTLRDRSTELLAELRDICDSRGYEYYLAPMTTAMAYLYGGYGYDFAVPAVVMPIDDALAFKAYIEAGNVKDRSIECMENNSRFATFSLSYVNENTTMIERLRGSDFKKLGVRVSIELLRPCTKDKALRNKEIFWECTGYHRVLSVKHQNINKPAKAAANFLKKTGATARLYRKMCRTYAGVESDKYYLKSYYIKPAVLDKTIFEDIGQIEFEGESFKVPRDVERYLQKSTAGTWKTKLELPQANLRPFVFFDNAPYSAIDENMRKSGKGIDEYLRNYEAWYAYTDEVVRFNSEKKRLWDLANRSGARAIIYHDLSKKMDQITRLREAKDYNALGEIFKDYDKEMHKFLELGMGLCPSKELMDIECELLAARGDKAIADKLLALTPVEHYQPVSR